MQMKNLEDKSRLYRALGEPIRLKIIEYLLKKGQCTCICELSNLLKRDQSVISRHIQILKDAGILNTNKEAKYLICCVKDKKKIMRILED
jgi:ArsR family transcriptional regulator